MNTDEAASDRRVPMWLKHLGSQWFYPVLVLALAPVLFFQAIANDLYKHLYTGQYIAHEWAFPDHSAFTFAPVRETYTKVHDTWLGELILYYAVEWFGITGVQVLRFLMVIALLALIHSIVRYTPHPVAWLMLFLLVLGSFHALMLRNNLMLVPGMILTVWFWYQARYKHNYGWLLFYPVLFAFWTNVHGTVRAGIGILFLFVAGDLISRIIRWDVDWRWIGMMVMTVGLSVLAVVFVKPQPDVSHLQAFERFVDLGERFVETEMVSGSGKEEFDSDRLANVEYEGFYETVRYYLQNTISAVDPDNLPSTEYRFPLDHYRFIYVLASLALIPLGIGLFVASWPSVRLDLLLAFLAVCVIGSGYIRTLALLPTVTVPILFIKQRLGDFPDLSRSKPIKYAGGLVIIVFVVYLGVLTVTDNTRAFIGISTHQVGFGPHTMRSERMADFGLENYPDDRVLTTDASGSYLVYKWWPEKKVSYDTKQGAYHPDYRNFGENGGPGYLERAEAYDMIVALIRTWDVDVMKLLLESPEWQLVAYDAGMIAFERVDQARYVPPEEARLIDVNEILSLRRSDRRQFERIERLIDTVRPSGR